MGDAGRWWVNWTKHDQPDLRVFCFGQAGSGAAPFRAWASEVPEGLEILAARLPGRESRIREPPLREWPAFLHSVVGSLEPFLDRPYALFGHCFGAFTAFEVAREFERRGTPPARLIAASQVGPSVWALPPGYDSPGDVRARLHRLGGTAEEVLANEELLELLLPAIEADFILADGYVRGEGPKLGTPISVFFGNQMDPAQRQDVAAWAAETTSSCELTALEADHFFTGAAWAELGRAVGKAVTPDVASPA